MDQLNNLKVGSLKVFKCLYEEGSTQKAAAKLNLSQSTISYELKRLREIFDDPLFIRDLHGMQANTKAQRLYPQVTRLLGGVEDLYNSQEVFDPALYTGTVTIALIEPLASRLMPKLFARIHKQAPQLELDFQVWTRETPEQLRRDEVDAALHHYQPDDPMLSATLLGPAKRIMACRRHHPILQHSQLTMTDLCQYPWIIQQTDDPQDTINPLERVSQLLQYKYKVLARGNYLPALVGMLEDSNALLFSSHLGLEEFQHKISLFEAPVELHQAAENHYALISKARSNSAFHLWLIEQLKRTLADCQPRL